jgi:two-component system sensor histidine kinase BaeS
MRRQLWIKFALLLLAVAALALSASLALRHFIIGEFRNYREGETEDRVYWVTADLEGTFEKHGGWNADVVAEDAVWALMLGMETRVLDADGELVMDSAGALDSLPPLKKARVRGVSRFDEVAQSREFIPYPLFLGGERIGRLEVRFMPPLKEEVFIQRSNRFLLVSFLVVGCMAVALSILFARKLTGPVRRLAVAAEAIGEGNLKVRVDVRGEDEIARLARAFNDMAQTLERHESLRKKLYANAAHELRTPLAAMRGELEGMQDGLIPVTRKQLHSLSEGTERLTAVIAGMEKLIQAEASALTMKKEELRLKPLLEGCQERFDALFQRQGIRLRVRCDENVMAAVDSDGLHQILANMLGNALKATEAGGNVTVRADDGGRELIITCEDTGCGIGKDELSFIFERFFRGRAGRLGLGLTIVKELVEAHGGRITVESEPGKGSIFTVFLPKT